MVYEDRIHCSEDVGTPMKDLPSGKIQINSGIPTLGARFMMGYILDFYLNMPLKWPEYVKIKLTDILKEVIDE